VYGVRGSPDQGWPFIEEFLINSLIEQLQQDGAENKVIIVPLLIDNGISRGGSQGNSEIALSFMP
ncbi:hypothetical protein GBA52_018182, partial [Prunus armeniaca]